MSAVHPSELSQQADAGFVGVAADQYDDLRVASRALGDRTGDHRYVLLERCCLVSSNCWTDGEAGAIYTASQHELSAIWDRHIHGILDEVDPEIARGLASILLDDLYAFSAGLERP